MADELGLDEMQWLADAATPGPWRPGRVEVEAVFVEYHEGLAGPGGERVVLRTNQHFKAHEHDARFCAAARMWVPAAIAEIRTLRTMLKAFGSENERELELRRLRAENAQLRANAAAIVRLANAGAGALPPDRVMVIEPEDLPR